LTSKTSTSLLKCCGCKFRRRGIGTWFAGTADVIVVGNADVIVVGKVSAKFGFSTQLILDFF
jgi:hypothetical protein